MKDQKGEDVALKKGAPVDVTIEADSKDTIKKKDEPRTFGNVYLIPRFKIQMYCIEHAPHLCYTSEVKV